MQNDECYLGGNNSKQGPTIISLFDKQGGNQGTQIGYANPCQSKMSHLVTKLSDETRFTEDEIWKLHIPFYKRCPKGKANLRQFQMFYKEYFPNEAAETFAANVFRTIDKRNNNYVEFAEFVKAAEVILKGSVEEKQRWVYAMYDVDNTDAVTRYDMYVIHSAAFKMLCGSTNVDLSTRRIDFLFNKIDKNMNGSVTFEEFKEKSKRIPALSKFLKL